ncbi:MAG: Glutamate/gamma-aminobutyrate antiporter [Candidatus Anoxychlamydiales bacterium]|nr:Glutamate/gamma-aminobutyrate antiporter [Candidatus Anoxychlamydiales bacterium]
MKKAPIKVMNLFTLMMVASAFGISIRNLPLIATTGMQMFFFATIAIIFFYIPIALVSAELATAFPKMGGIAVWVTEAFGKKWGFVAIFLQWSYMNIGVISMLFFISGTIASTISENLANQKLFLLCSNLIIIWLFTYLNSKGLKVSTKISMFFFIIGIFFPAILLITISFTKFFLQGSNILDISFTFKNLLPDFNNLSTLIILIGFMRAFGGIEASAVHANSVKKPKKNYPIAILFVVFLCFSINVFGGFSIALIEKKENINLVAGIINIFRYFLSQNNLLYLLPIIGTIVAIGQIGGFSTWLMGPIKGILEIAQEGELPKFFQKVNKKNAPINLMIIQAFIISITSSLFLLLGANINIAFWIALVVAMMVYFSMYFLMFLSAIRLRYTRKDVKRSFKIPFKNIGMWIVCILGMTSVTIGFLMAVFPPSQLEVTNYIKFLLTILIFVLVIFAIPFIIHKLKKPSWNPNYKK